MNTATTTAVAALVTLGLAIPQSNAQTKDDAGVLRLLTCQDSWLEWKDDPVKRQKFIDDLKTNFKQNDRDGAYAPIKAMSVLGHSVFQLYPQSVGMGVGYSVIVNASFDVTKASLEKQMGKPFDRCQAASEGKSCERELAKQKTVMLMEGSRGREPKTLFGCYYLYEK
jgi:hypothetical protein